MSTVYKRTKSKLQPTVPGESPSSPKKLTPSCLQAALVLAPALVSTWVLLKRVPTFSCANLSPEARGALSIFPSGFARSGTATQPLGNSDRILNDSDSARQSGRIGAILVTTICVQTHPIVNQSQLASGNHRSKSRRPSLSTSPRGLEIHFLESR